MLIFNSQVISRELKFGFQDLDKLLTFFVGSDKLDCNEMRFKLCYLKKPKQISLVYDSRSVNKSSTFP